MPEFGTQIKDAPAGMDGRGSALYIIGNGFDLMHGVLSSYRNFRDSLGKRSNLRFTLETFIDKEDLWGDFEDSLAYLNRESMLNSVDDQMQDFKVLEEDDDDFSAADFFAAIEMATMPADIIRNELPVCFRQWVNKLCPRGSVKPLIRLLNLEARYINFNYTEFLETIYGIKRDSILYIHGDRRNEKEGLILGHGHDTEELFDTWYEENRSRAEFCSTKRDRKGKSHGNDNAAYLAYFLEDDSKGNWKSQARFDAINLATDRVEAYYDDSAKKTQEVLEKSKRFFMSLHDVEEIIIIGHSLSSVDDLYYEEIIKSANKANSLKWRISWYSPDDLKRIERFIKKMNIRPSQVELFQL